MSGYLMRLTTRGRAVGEAQSMRPLVRSASPIAERDQRIGMMGFEGLEFDAAAPAEPGFDAGSGEEGIFQPPASPSITAASYGPIGTDQQGMANPEATTIIPQIPTAWPEAAATSTPAPSDIGSPRIGAPDPARAQGDLLPPSMASRHPPQHQAPEPLGIPPVTPGKHGVADVEVSVSSAVHTHAEAPSPGVSPTGSASHQSGQALVHTRSIRQTRQVDSTRLEPSPQSLAARSEPTPEDASVSTAEAGEGPRVVIGRVNVEVVPPPTAPPSTAGPRPGPLTAASVSVIGPLGGGIRPGQRLSLRHR